MNSSDLQPNSQPKTLKEIRISLGKSQDDIAIAVGVKQQAISLWESGKRYPTLDNAVRLAHVLGISLDDLAKSMKLIEFEGSSK